jgi:WhiB family transcriptional regulator, redox-sensing transcriptional regulator
MANAKRNSANIPCDRSVYEQMADELDELAMVPTDVLAAWVTDRGRCLWESTFGDPPEWTGEDEPDRELATRMCAGCPVRAECLELELQVGSVDTVGVWGALNEDDRRALHAVWSRRRRFLLEAMPDDGEER